MKRLKKKIRITRHVDKMRMTNIHMARIQVPNALTQASYEALPPRVKNYWIPWALADGKEKERLRREGRVPYL